MRNSKLIDAISVTSLFGALLTILFSSWNFPPRFDKQLHSAIGQALAEEALSLRGPSGQVTLLTRDTETFPQPALDLLLKSFQRELRRAEVKIAGTQFLQTDPLRPMDVPSGDFYELIRRTPADSIIVSVLGPPLLTEDQRRQLGAIKPKIVAFCPGNMGENVDLKQLFGSGLLHAAVVSRRGTAQGADLASKPPRGFDQLYMKVRADDTVEKPAVSIQSQ